MSDKRTFIKTSTGALHKPSCYSVKRLVNPTETLDLTPDELERVLASGCWMAADCWKYGALKEVEVKYGWRMT